MVEVTSLPGLEVSWWRDGCCVFFSLSGEMDLANAEAVSGLIQTASNGTNDHLIIGCDALTFIDSTGLRTILTAQEKFDGVALVSPTAHVRRLLEVTGVEGLLVTHETVHEARSSFHDVSDAESG